MVSHWVRLVVCTWLLLYGSLFLSVWNVSNEMKRK